MRPSPFELWQQAGGDAGEYRRLMREHGHLVPGTPAPLPCGWPGYRADDDEDSRARGTTPAAGPGPDGALVEPLAPARRATEAAPPVGVRGTTPGGDADPQVRQPRPGHPPARAVRAGDTGLPPAPFGGGPVQVPVPGAPGAGSEPEGEALPSAASPSGQSPAGAARTGAAAPAGRGLPGQAFREAREKAVSERNAGSRRGRDS